MQVFEVSLHSLERFDEIKEEWLQLEEQSDCSYFQSWGWIGTWLKHIAVDLQPLIVKVWLGDTLVGIGVFLQKHLHRHLIVQSNALFLNEYPFDGLNMVIEYNGLLTLREHRQSVYEHTIQYLFEHRPMLDEIFFGAMSDHEPVRILKEMQNCRGRLEPNKLVSSPTWSIDLTTFGLGIDAFLSSLSKNRRAQIRRSIRLYEEMGPLKLNMAKDPSEALDFFTGLKKLHTLRWNKKGKGGSFANQHWEGFHRALIKERFVSGEVQLLQVSNSQTVIGYLYNFIWRNRVYVLQTGFVLAEDKRLMPGYVVHIMAIAYNQRNGMTVYDLMHGDSVYKRILSNNHNLLTWYSVQRKRWKFSFEDRMVGFVNYLKGAGG